MPSPYVSLRKRRIPPNRQRVLLGIFPVPGTEPRNPPQNHHGVDLATIRSKIDLNRYAIKEGCVAFPGLGVSKHPMTIVTASATYVAGWALRDGTRSISILGEPSLRAGKILFLYMGEPMVHTGLDEAVCVTEPVIFIGRRFYQEVSAPGLPVDTRPSNEEFAWATAGSEIALSPQSLDFEAVGK